MNWLSGEIINEELAQQMIDEQGEADVYIPGFVQTFACHDVKKRYSRWWFSKLFHDAMEIHSVNIRWRYGQKLIRLTADPPRLFHEGERLDIDYVLEWADDDDDNDDDGFVVPRPRFPSGIQASFVPCDLTHATACAIL